MRGLSEENFFFAPPVSLELHPAVEFSRLNPLAKSLCFSLRVRGTIYPADPLALGHSAVLQYYDLVSAFSAASAGSGPRGALDPEYSSRGIVVGSIAVPPAVPQRPSASGKAALLAHKPWSRRLVITRMGHRARPKCALAHTLIMRQHGSAPPSLRRDGGSSPPREMQLIQLRKQSVNIIGRAFIMETLK